MVELIIAAGIIIAFMLAFIFVLFKNIIKELDENAKKYFVNKMEYYDYILEEKQERIAKITNEINEIELDYKNILRKEPKEEIKRIEKTEIQEEIITRPMKKIEYNLSVPEYKEANFFSNYKELKRIFNIDSEKVIKEFIKEHKNTKEEKEYNEIKKIRDKFDEDTIYQCLTLEVKEQIEILDEVLTDKEKKLVKFNDIIKNDKFNINTIIKLLNDKMEEKDPYIYIYTNLTKNKYAEIDKHILVRPYANISEGIIIKYRNKIYDYSI